MSDDFDDYRAPATWPVGGPIPEAHGYCATHGTQAISEDCPECVRHNSPAIFALRAEDRALREKGLTPEQSAALGRIPSGPRVQPGPQRVHLTTQRVCGAGEPIDGALVLHTVDGSQCEHGVPPLFEPRDVVPLDESDGEDAAELTASVEYAGLDHFIRLVDPNTFPSHPLWMTPDAADELAALLVKRATEARAADAALVR